MIFIWKNGQFYGIKVSFIEIYNEAIKKGRQKHHIVANYFRTLNDVNEKVVCFEEAWNKMNREQKNNIVAVQDIKRNNVVHIDK